MPLHQDESRLNHTNHTDRIEIVSFYYDLTGLCLMFLGFNA